MSTQVLSLDDPVAAEPSVSGGKGATLARLAALELPVPDGAVVTTAAYHRLTDDPAIEARITDLDAAVADGRTDEAVTVAGRIREAIRGRSLPDGVRERLTELCPDGPYAVRSSATSEDAPEASFAGQHDTSLGVAAGDLTDAVVECMASLFTDRAVRYRAEQGISTADLGMAVVVQRLVEPDVSGILFTADPITGTRSVTVLDAGPGRGERQVSGETTADSIRFDRDRGEVIDYRLGAERTEPVLTDADVTALATIGNRVADTLGGPQDIEWAIADGEIAVLQARPITALFPVPSPDPTDDRTHVYVSFGHRQGMPDAMPPLVLDVWRGLMDDIREQFGLSQRFAAMAGGRLYIDLTAYLASRRLRDRIVTNFEIIDEPGATALRDLLADTDAFPVTEPSPTGWLRALRTTAGLVPLIRLLVGSLPSALVAADPENEPTRLREAYDSQCERALRRIHSKDSTADRIAAASEELRRSPDWLLEGFYGPFLSAFIAGALLRRLVPSQADSVDALALGIEDDAVFGMTLAIGDLADTARESPAVASALREGASVETIADTAGGETFLAALESFLDDYGFRAVGEIDISRPRYRDDPTPLLHVVGATLDSTERGTHRALAAKLQARADAAERTLVTNANPVVRPLVRRLTSIYRGYIGIREHPKFALARLLAAYREQVTDAGEQLVRAGALPDPEDVWLLTRSELTAALADPRTAVGIDIPARRRTFERHQRLTAPRVITSEGEVPRGRPPVADADTDTTATLVGTGAAPGIAAGPVQVVTDPSTERFEHGSILVTTYTDPGWTPLFPSATAIVTEVGGRLTHGSLVAREYGIPAVVAVEDATTRLRSGDRVRVDGTRGVVERLDAADAEDRTLVTDDSAATR